MPRARGEADKLGNYYESIWTVDSLLDLLPDEALTMQVEPFDKAESQGVEFVKTLCDGVIEYHSAKRQKTGNAWSLTDLARTNPRGQSILADLFAKLATNPRARAVFVSGTGANELYELSDRARRCANLTDWEGQKLSKHINENFQDIVLRFCGGNPALALDGLKRLRVVALDEQELKKRLEQKLAQWIYRPDGAPLVARDAIAVLQELVINRLGQILKKEILLDDLAKAGYGLRIWAKDNSLRSRVVAINETYSSSIQGQFINRQRIGRAEANTALIMLLKPDGPKAVMIVGPAGLGKSCVVTETVAGLEGQNISVLCLRLDNCPHGLTTRNLGVALGLPASPAIVLGGIADGRKCVLVLDQIDALSLVSGRNEHLWPVLHELITEASRVPNMRLLMACRAFDLHHDSRLRDLAGKDRLAVPVEVAPLNVDEIHAAMRAAGRDPAQLGAVQTELLRNPFNLQLFLGGNPDRPASFRSTKDLLDLFWERKCALVSPYLRDPKSWDACIGALAEALSHGQTSAPIDLLDPYGEDPNILASHGILILENRRWRFFHEAFGDYAFARHFVRAGKDVVTYLPEAGEQHLYRRSQLRQILNYERDRDLPAYTKTLRRLLTEPKVRLHIKKLALEWLSRVPEPSEGEWRVLERFLEDPVLGPHVVSALWESLPWFDLLDKLGLWPDLIAQDRNGLGERFCQMLGMESMMRHRSAQIARLLSPHIRDLEWRRRFGFVLRFRHVYHSREMFDLVLDCVDAGLFGGVHHEHDLLLHQLLEQRPDYALEYLSKHLGRLRHLAALAGQTDPFYNEEAKRSIRANEVKNLADKFPEKFAQTFAPLVQELAITNECSRQDGGLGDNIWRYVTFGAEHDFPDALLFSTARALKVAAALNPEMIEALTKPWGGMPHWTIRLLLFSAWTGNPQAFANTAADYLMKNPDALTLGYGAYISMEGDPTASVARELITAISPHCSEEMHNGLEATVREFKWSQEDPKRSRYLQYALLQALLPERLGVEARDLFKILEREFEGKKLVLPHPQLPERTAHDNLKPVDVVTVRDEDWLRFFDQIKDSLDSGELGGNTVSLIGVLGPLRSRAAAEPQRFCLLVQEIPDDVSPRVFCTIFEGIAHEGGPAAPDAPPVDIKCLFKAIERLHRLPKRPCGASICSAVERLAEFDWPPQIADIVSYYALHDPDPATEGNISGKELINTAINTVRGRAGDAIAHLLFKHSNWHSQLAPVIEGLTRDPSLCVRAISIRALIALLNHDKSLAVTRFLEVCASEPRFWASHYVEDFLYYATFSHYRELRSFLLSMLGSVDAEIKRIAARQICLAGFKHADAESDMATVLAGDAVCRSAAAEIYSRNLIHISIRRACEKHLLPLLNDEAHQVRQSAESWVAHLRFVTANNEWRFFRQYLQTRAFEEEPGACLYELKEMPAVPKEVVIEIVNRAINLSRRDTGDTNFTKAFRFASVTPTLVVRLYLQAEDERLKTQCLDLLDSMLQLGWNEAAIEMAKAEE